MVRVATVPPAHRLYPLDGAGSHKDAGRQSLQLPIGRVRLWRSALRIARQSVALLPHQQQGSDPVHGRSWVLAPRLEQTPLGHAKGVAQTDRGLHQVFARGEAHFPANPRQLGGSVAQLAQDHEVDLGAESQPDAIAGGRLPLYVRFAQDAGELSVRGLSLLPQWWQYLKRCCEMQVLFLIARRHFALQQLLDSLESRRFDMPELRIELLFSSISLFFCVVIDRSIFFLRSKVNFCIDANHGMWGER